MGLLINILQAVHATLKVQEENYLIFFKERKTGALFLIILQQLLQYLIHLATLHSPNHKVFLYRFYFRFHGNGFVFGPICQNQILQGIFYLSS